ncbi:hypothetical protein QVD17_40412 [Tagetes erecta]|uniref:Uncharacterized protein n=1 Tax=Tagetes erecta TaxID=13708 RepID=A0AAD8JPY1_TARER|nr:hypothetical protein QVD17_40412 [Tagetes erecta]
MLGGRKLLFSLAAAVVLIIILTVLKIDSSSSWNKEAVVEFFTHMSDRLGNWAIPVYVAVHTISLALCLPYAVFFEAVLLSCLDFSGVALCLLYKNSRCFSLVLDRKLSSCAQELFGS